MAKNETSQHNHDAIYGIVRDVKNGALNIEDAVAKIKGLDDATQLTNESFEEAENVTKNNEEDDNKDLPTAEPSAVDPGEGADFDINDTVGVDPSDDTTTLRVVPDHQLVSKNTEIEDGVVVAKEPEEDAEDEDTEAADKRPINRRKQKKLDAKEAKSTEG